MAFNGLRRALEVHPESLSRALRRLERYGMVVRSEGRYRLTGGPGAARPGAGLPADWRTIAEVELAGAFDPAQVLGTLAGRWVGNLRWEGVYDRDGSSFLVWSRTDGPGHLLLGLRDRHLKVYVESPDDPSDPPGRGALNLAAQELLVFALGRIRAAALDAGRTGLLTCRLDAPPTRTVAN